MFENYEVDSVLGSHGQANGPGISTLSAYLAT